ncbi:MAG: leucine-rich repeat domain-containing protein [Pseudohongiellaceae bacterium]
MIASTLITYFRHQPPFGLLGCVLALVGLSACSQQFAVSVNNQAVFDPNSRLPNSEAVNANLQGCINLAMRQQLIEDESQLEVLSCANSEITAVENIGQLTGLRFLDLGDNNIVNVTPLENLTSLGGLNLANNAIRDINPLINLRSLVSVSLIGNNNIPCSQLRLLESRLKENLSQPESCAD